MKPGGPLLLLPRLLYQLRERICCQHYSLNTEKAQVYRVRFSLFGASFSMNFFAKSARSPY